MDRAFVLAVYKISEFKVHKMRFSLDGLVTNQVVDTVDNGLVIRKSNNRTVIISNNEVIQLRLDNKLNTIKT